MEKVIKKTNSYKPIAAKIKNLLCGSKKKILITVIVVLVLVCITWIAFAKQKVQPQYQTQAVQKGIIISTVTESGNVTSNSSAGVGSPTTGIITEIYVKDGDSVTQGQNLFKVKSIATAQEIAGAYSTYENALVSANSASQGKIGAQATLEKDRLAVITASQAVTTMQNNINVSAVNPTTKQAYTQNDIDAINSALTSARETFTEDEQKYTQSDQNIVAANASVNAAWLAYQATQDSIVTAPISGTVANIAVQTGDQITASGGNLSSNQSTSTTSTTNAVLSIGNFSTPYIKVQASEVDAPTIHAGQKATITMDAFTNKTFVGTVEQVDSVGTVTTGVVTYNVFVSFIAPLPEIKPGMSATVTIQTARKDNVITVPSSAIQNSNGQSVVQVLKNGQVTTVPVTTGIISDSDTEITAGLSEGDNVITSVRSSSTQASGSGTSPFGGGLRIGGGFGGGFRGGGGPRGG